jgi:hypothetical protein
MNPNFHAGHVTVEDMGDYLLVGFADRQFATVNYLTLQRAHEFDEQDRRTGMAEVYIERNDQGFSGYGGMESFELLPDRVRVRFDARSAPIMAGCREMEISFDLNREQFGVLQAGLRRCFDGFNYFLDHEQADE